MPSGHFAEDMTGQPFGRLIVLEKYGTHDSRAYWKCRCECGNITISPGLQLRSGKIRSCGCLRIDKNRGRLTKWITINGVRKSMTQWAGVLGITLQTVHRRAKKEGISAVEWIEKHAGTRRISNDQN